MVREVGNRIFSFYCNIKFLEMYLTERHIIKNNKELDMICFKPKIFIIGLYIWLDNIILKPKVI